MFVYLCCVCVSLSMDNNKTTRATEIDHRHLRKQLAVGLAVEVLLCCVFAGVSM